MLIVRNPSTNPYFNLAAEEYLLKNFDEDIFMLWRNENTVVVGKHQNALSEVNMTYALANHVNVARRLSGGGTVFHDSGNLNFTFIGNTREGDEIKVDFAYFTLPIIEVLQTMGVQATLSGRNDLLIDGMKFSGNAEHVYRQKKRTLHHGTLLFDSRIENLSAALKVDPLKYTDKSVKSFRSKVTNISNHLPSPLHIDAFHERVVDYMAARYEDVAFYTFTTDDIAAITELEKSKYGTWEWIFGYSPKYKFQNIVSTTVGDISIELEVEKGLIQSYDISGDTFDTTAWNAVLKQLINCRHFPEDIELLLSSDAAANALKPATANELLAGLF